MGMDGLSIANTGAVKESTSAELTARTEQAIQADTTNAARQVQGLSVNRRIRPKDDEDEGAGRNKDEKEEKTEEEEIVQERLSKAKGEISLQNLYDYKVIDITPEQAAKEISDIIKEKMHL